MAMKVYTTQQVADQFGVTPSRVKQLARDHNCGSKLGRMLVFTTADVERMSKRKKLMPGQSRQRKFGSPALLDRPKSEPAA